MAGIDPLSASNAYRNLANMASRAEKASDTSGGDLGESAAGGTGGGFSQMLETAMEDAVDTLRASEVMSARAVTGQADVTDVVQAVTAAEVTLQTAVALRDRMVSAYQEIMRMPI